MKFRKKPVVIDAIQWSGNLGDAQIITDFAEKPVGFSGQNLVIYTLEGQMLARPGDWIIRGVVGEIYPCKPAIFEATYEPV